MTSELEVEFVFVWHLLFPDAPEPERECRCIEDRRFRFDFCWPDAMVAVEIQGGTWSRGRHVRGAGYRRDCEKLDLAQSSGWRVFYLTRQMLEDEPERWLGIIWDAIKETE